MSIDTLRFLNMVAPVSDETWITIHHRVFIPGQKDPIFPGNAHKTVQTAQKDAEYWARKGHCVYISMGMYRNPGEPGRIYPKADRTYQNLIGCRNLYLDVDVKEGGYATSADALAAIVKFITWSGLPLPTVIVGSGSGGFHVYWTLNTACDQAEFKDLAGRLINAAIEFGLLFDRQCTRDSTRLLRIAGTWNFKHATPAGVEPVVPATPVTLPVCKTAHVDIDVLRKALVARWKPTLTQEVNGKGRVDGHGLDAHGLPLDENSDLTGGMKKDYAPVSIDEVAKHCPFVKNTLDAGGANLVGEPQWHAAITLACHVTDPSATAHRLSKDNQYYNFDDTEQKLAVAQQARVNNPNLGPPRCNYIANEREECKTCPHLALHTTPVSVGFKIQPTNGHAYHASPIIPSANSIELPSGYHYDGGNPNDHRVYKSVTDASGNIEGIVAFEYPLIPGTAMLEAGKPFQFIFDTIQGERRVTKRFDTTIVSDTTSFSKAFAGEGMTINNKPDIPRAFVSSYISQLQSKEETLISVPAFGWSQDHNGDMGFAFAGEYVSPAGSAKCVRAPDGTENYRVMGDEQVWIDLMKQIVTADRPDLACMIASSFGAPLVGLAGELGLLMGVTSPASGIGKSTALLAGQAVWSSPRVGGLSDTVNYTFNKAATLRHLPLFYDEIKGERQLRDMTLIAFQLTGGREKGRSDRSGKMREVKEFRTLCGYAANGSIVSGVREADKGTDASWLRIFEMHGIVLPEAAPDFAYNVNTLLSGLALNHGGVGKKYAALLGTNHNAILKTLTAFKADFAKALGANPKVERYWIAAQATTIVGALLANSMGVVTFPINAMKDFMFSEFNRMRTEMAEDPSDYSKDNSLLATLGAFLNEKQPHNMIKLDKTWTNPTRPPKGYATIQNEQNNWGTLEVQVSGEPLMLRISDKALSEWCARTKHPKNILVTQMKAKLNAKLSSGIIGSGSRLGGAREMVWGIQATGTILEESLEYGLNYKFLAP